MSYTKGPWTWHANAKTGQVYLATEGRGRVYVMGFTRHKMDRAQPMFQRHKEGCDGACRGCGLMVPVSEAGYETDHNGDYDINHPDALLIAAAPELLEACEGALDWLGECASGTHQASIAEDLRAAIAKAEGRT